MLIKATWVIGILKFH